MTQMAPSRPAAKNLADKTLLGKEGDKRALKILAKSVYRELKASGYDRSEVVGFTNELLDLVTSELRDSDAPTQ